MTPTPPCSLCPQRIAATGKPGHPGLKRYRGVCKVCYSWACAHGLQHLLLPAVKPPVPWNDRAVHQWHAHGGRVGEGEGVGG